jgi:phosphoenolpyruvate-protein phosphotransferase (PTS system enzyme I)
VPSTLGCPADLSGLAASPGWAIGTAYVLAAHALLVAHEPIHDTQIGAEQGKLKAAIAATLTELAALRASLAFEKHAEISAFIEVHELMLHDPVLVDETLALIASRRINAAWALSEQVQVLAGTFAAMDDAYLRERAFDVQQVGERVLQHLDVHSHSTPMHTQAAALAKDTILICRDLAPADFAQWQRANVRGLITEVGGVSSHTAIVARAHGLPSVLAVAGAVNRVQDGDCVVLDGHTGSIWLNPDAARMALLLASKHRWQQQLDKLNDASVQPAVTQCGQHIQILGNIESPQDMSALRAAHLDGVGLMRSEFLFMGRATLPSEDEQFAAYAAVVQALQGKPAIIRTLDVGADKLLNAHHASEVTASPNPALGLRAIRYSLANEAVFLQQLQALLRAAALGPVHILLPMIGNADEINACKALLQRAQTILAERGTHYGDVQLGIMVEVPAAAIAIESLVPLVDFCSIGTNDLIQYTLAIDRTDAQVSYLYDPVHPALTCLIAQVVRVCTAAGKHVSLCGEMAGDAALTHHLLSLGLRSFSLAAGQAAGVKAAVRRWNSTNLPMLTH